MSFTNRRGRPKKLDDETDLGTPELRRKRQQNVTIEPLDWLRQHELISEKQHWCGLHFRWLYTLRYGTTTVQSLDATRINGIIHYRENNQWQTEREEEWKLASRQLEEQQLLNIALRYCVYQQHLPPSWYLKTPTPLQQLSLALRQLEELWCKEGILH